MQTKDGEITALVTDLEAVRTRAVELSFRCNEISFSSSEHKKERLRLQAELQALEVG